MEFNNGINFSEKSATTITKQNKKKRVKILKTLNDFLIKKKSFEKFKPDCIIRNNNKNIKTKDTENIFFFFQTK